MGTRTESSSSPFVAEYTIHGHGVPESLLLALSVDKKFSRWLGWLKRGLSAAGGLPAILVHLAVPWSILQGHSRLGGPLPWAVVERLRQHELAFMFEMLRCLRTI